MTATIVGFVTASAAISPVAMLILTGRMQALLARHETALATMREQLHAYDTICRRGGSARNISVRHRQGSSETWVDLVIEVPGVALRFPIRPEEMDGFVAMLRGERPAEILPFQPGD